MNTAITLAEGPGSMLVSEPGIGASLPQHIMTHHSDYIIGSQPKSNFNDL
jgi:hypothetical protein